MKIITSGVPKPPTPPKWPIDKDFICTWCGCEFRIEEGDKYTYRTGRMPEDDNEMTVYCPDCNSNLRYYEYTQIHSGFTTEARAEAQRLREKHSK